MLAPDHSPPANTPNQQPRNFHNPKTSPTLTASSRATTLSRPSPRTWRLLMGAFF
jgi:hypothetical protein